MPGGQKGKREDLLAMSDKKNRSYRERGKWRDEIIGSFREGVGPLAIAVRTGRTYKSVRRALYEARLVDEDGNRLTSSAIS